MDTNTKTQYTNTFAKGMNTDVSDAFITSDQYRMANNLRYITDDEENTGEMHVIEGAKKVLGNIEGVIRGTISIRNYGVLICEQTQSGAWSVIRWDLNDPSNPKTVCTIGDHPLSKNKLSLVSKYEDENNIKVYIADGENPVMVVNIMSGKVTDYNKITSYPNAILAAPTFNGLIDGALKEGVVQYSYQLYNTWGTATDASIPTRLIPLHNKDTELENTNNFKGVEQGKTSNKGVSISIKINSSFERIRVFRITYVEAGQQPLIELILDTKILNTVGDVYTVNDSGFEALQIYSVEEYNGIAGIHIIPKVIESKDEYMFAACIKTTQTEFDKLFDADKFLAKQSEGDIYDLKTPYVNEFNGKNGEYVSWQFIRKELVGDANGSTKELIKQSKDGYANPSNTYNYTSLRRDELYRFGIILYNNKGGHSSVFWIADIRTPSTYRQYYNTFGLRDGKLYVYSLGIKFHVELDKINKDIKEKDSTYEVVAYEIVRCNRTEKDIATVAQGVLSRPGRRFNGYTPEAGQVYPLTPTGFLTTANVVARTGLDKKGILDDVYYRYQYQNCATIPNDNIFQFVCPEYCYQGDSFENVLDNDNFYIRTLEYLYGSTFDNAKLPDDNAVTFEYLDLGVSDDDDNAKSITLNVYGDDTQDDISVAFPGNEYTKFAYSLNGFEILLFSFIQSYIYYARTSQNTMDISTEAFNSLYNISHRHQYIKLYNSASQVRTPQGNTVVISLLPNIDIVDTSTSKALNWDDFAEGQNKSGGSSESYPLKYPNNIVNIGSDSFVNWVSTCLYGVPIVDSGTSWIHYYGDGHENDHLKYTNSYLGGINGPGGKTVLIETKYESNRSPEYIHTTVQDSYAQGHAKINSMLGTYLCNLRKNAVPYGGHDEESKRLSTYYSYGYYTTEEDIDVYAGDCFILPFEYVATHKAYHPLIPNLRNTCIVYSIPVETNINLAYTYGYEFSKRFLNNGHATNLQDQPNDVNGIFILDKPLYAYNGAYSASNKLQVYSAYQDDPTTIYNEDYRCYYSNPKDNKESIDNWTIYQPANFLDVDTRKGPITGLRTFHNNLVFWQRDATGLFSVNERTTITDESNMPLLLGTGGVLARYDYINTSNGMMENQFADTQSDSTLYWWDHNKANICAYAGGLESLILSKVKNVLNFLNKMQKQDRLHDITNPQYSSPALAFDRKYNELIASVTNGDDHDKGSLVYSELTQQFVGLYDIKPDYCLTFPNNLYLLKNINKFSNNGIYKWNCGEEYAYGITDNKLLPYLKYIVNDNAQYNKVFDNVAFGSRVYGGGSMSAGERVKDVLKSLTFTFSTPLKQKGKLKGDLIENVEYDFRFAIPRNNDAAYGDRLRGKTMQCELESDTNSLDLSIQYITTKYRISWS